MDPLAARLVETLRARSETVALAESLTAGLVASRLAESPGASDALRGGFVVYTRDAKVELLGVREEPVSAAAAEALAREARARLRATWGLALTGFAGPTGRDVGLVYVGLADARGARSRELRLAGERNAIRAQAADAAIRWLLDEASR